MASWSHELPGGIVPRCAVFDEPGNAVWTASAAGEIVSLRILGQRFLAHGTGYADPVGIAMGREGLSIWIVEASGEILRALKEGADRSGAESVATVPGPVAGAVLHPDEHHMLVLTAAGTLLSVDLKSGEYQTIADGFTDPLAVSTDRASGPMVVLHGAPEEHQIRTVDLDSGNVGSPVPLDEDASAILAAPLNGAMAALVSSDVTGGLTLVGLAGQPIETGESAGNPVRAIVRWGRLVLCLSDGRVTAMEWGLDEGLIPITLPPGPVFTSGYAHAEIDLASLGLSPSNIAIEVEEGPDAGFVSAAVESPGEGGVHRFVVGAAHKRGEFHVTARRLDDDSLVGRARFRVTSWWPDQDVGPPVVLTGEQQLFAEGSWGGGPAGPQNINTVPAPEFWRVLVVLVNLKDQAYPQNLGPIQATWRNLVVDPGRSVRTYFEEVSRYTTPGPATPRGTTIDLVDDAIHGPVSMDVGWGDAFEPMSMASFWKGWKPKPTFLQDCTSAVCAQLQDAGIAELLLRQTDAVVFVVRTASESGVSMGGKLFPALYVWPRASGATFWWKTEFSTSFIRKPVVLMPDRLPSSKPPPHFDFDEALAHEIGHTLGMEDLYNRGQFPAEIGARVVGGLDIMGSERTFPHFSLPNQMRLGWIDPGWIQKFDFGANQSGGTVTLQALGSFPRSGPPAGRRAGIEVRVRDGWNYYFEYRRTQPGQIGDQGLAGTAGSAEVVVGTDVKTQPGTLMGIVQDAVEGAVGANPARPPVLRLPIDADGDGPLLDTTNEDYEETDVTNPTRQHDFRLVFEQVEPADPNAARVRVEYVRAHRPELEIKPAPGRGNWKSPDIDIMGPLGPNRIVKGRHHTIRARVRNKGSLAASNVRVTISWLPFTTSPGAWTNLDPPDPQTIAANGEAFFEAGWIVPDSLQVAGKEVEHFCVRVAIDRFVNPLDASQDEIVVHNNWAQSNFDTKVVAHGSPSDRSWTGLSVSNPLNDSAVYLTLPEQDGPFFRAYVGNEWLNIGPDETRMVEIGYESLAGDPVHGQEFEDAFESGRFERPTRLAFNSFVVAETEQGCAAPELQWGAELRLRPGVRTELIDVRREGEAVRGQVIERVSGASRPVDRGEVVVVYWRESAPSEQPTAVGDVEQDGTFFARIPEEMMQVIGQERIWGEALYSGSNRWAPCRSGSLPFN